MGFEGDATAGLGEFPLETVEVEIEEEDE